MAVHWIIKFMSLRSGTVYTVSIYDSNYPSNTPVELKGGVEPFTTEENNNEDAFQPTRTQTGYLRIADDDRDVNGNPFNWKDLVPLTDTDRPVTLTHRSGQNTVVDWQGYMQAQNFSGSLYGNPQTREYPVQCVLSAMDSIDINYSQKKMQNFAYLLNYAIDQLPTLTIDNIYVQGGLFAQKWLLKYIDWQNFLEINSENKPGARFSLFKCIEGMCQYWGWTARTCGKDLYLVCADDAAQQKWLTLTKAQLEAMASGGTAGDTDGNFFTCSIQGDIYASIHNDDFMQRGYRRARISAGINKSNANIIETNTEVFYKELKEAGWQSVVNEPDGSYRYTNDVLNIDLPTLTGNALSGYGSFNYAMLYRKADINTVQVTEVQIKAPRNVVTPTVYASLELDYEHCYSNNWLELHGTVYKKWDKCDFTDDLNPTIGQKSMYMAIGIGTSRNSAVWLDTYGVWSDAHPYVQFSVGNNTDLLYFHDVRSQEVLSRPRFQIPNNVRGKLFIDFMGADDPDLTSFEIADFYVKMWHGDIVDFTYQIAQWWKFENDENVSGDKTYTADNQSQMRDDYNADTIFAADNDALYGYGLLMNPDMSYMENVTYDSVHLTTPEQHFADRIVSCWSQSRRRIKMECLSNKYIGVFIGEMTPRYKAYFESQLFYPMAISHKWRDDVTILTILELPSA